VILAVKQSGHKPQKWKRNTWVTDAKIAITAEMETTLEFALACCRGAVLPPTSRKWASNPRRLMSRKSLSIGLLLQIAVSPSASGKVESTRANCPRCVLDCCCGGCGAAVLPSASGSAKEISGCIKN
jgi:hypothetical protein